MTSENRVVWMVGAGLAGIHLLIALINLSPLIDSYTVSVVLDVNLEGTAVVWLSSSALLAIAAVAGFHAWRASVGSALRRGWLVVGAAFVVLSLDETASLHELAGEKASGLFQVDWLPSLYLWVLVVAPVAAVFAIWMLRWFGTSLGWDSIEGRMAIVAVVMWMAVPVLEALDPVLGGPRLLITAEETMEGLGQVLMLTALLLHATDRSSAPSPTG